MITSGMLFMNGLGALIDWMILTGICIIFPGMNLSLDDSIDSVSQNQVTLLLEVLRFHFFMDMNPDPESRKSNSRFGTITPLYSLRT